MKKNDKVSKVLKPKGSGKTKLLMVLMFLQVVVAYAKEQFAVVLNQVAANKGRTVVFLDKSGNGRPDSSITLFDNNDIDLVLRGYLREGTPVSYEDAGELRASSIPTIFSSDLLSVDGQSVLDLFGRNSYYFDKAWEKYFDEYRKAESTAIDEKRRNTH